MTKQKLPPLPLRERAGERGLVLCAIALLAIFGTQFAEGTAIPDVIQAGDRLNLTAGTTAMLTKPITLRGWISIVGLTNAWDDFSGVPPAFDLIHPNAKITIEEGLKLAETNGVVAPTLSCGIQKDIALLNSADRIDFNKSYSAAIQGVHNILQYQNVTSSVAFNADSGFYEVSGTDAATGKLTFSQTPRALKMTVSPVINLRSWIQKGDLPNISAMWCDCGAMSYGAGLWMAVSVEGYVATSSDDDQVWNLRGRSGSVDATGSLRNIATASWFGGAGYGDGIWMVTNLDGRVAVSSDDGNTWSLMGRNENNTADNPNSLRAIISSNLYGGARYGKGVWMVVKYSHGIVAISSDNGATWKQKGNLGSGSWFGGVAYGNGLWMAVDRAGPVAVSYDNGATWTRRYTLSNGGWWWSAASYANGEWGTVAQATGTLMVSSDDGATWRQKIASFGGNLPTSEWYSGAGYGDGKWLIVNRKRPTAVCSAQEGSAIKFAGDSAECSVAKQETFYVYPSLGADEITFEMRNLRLISAEILDDRLLANKLETRNGPFVLEDQFNQSGKTVELEIENKNRLVDAMKLELSPGSVLPNFVCDTAASGKTSIGVQANLTTGTPLELKGDWSEYKSGSFETTNAGTLRIETAASLPQSNITIGTGGKLQFASDIEVTTGAGTILDLRGCSSVSGGKSLTLGAGARLIF